MLRLGQHLRDLVKGCCRLRLGQILPHATFPSQALMRTTLLSSPDEHSVRESLRQRSINNSTDSWLLDRCRIAIFFEHTEPLQRRSHQDAELCGGGNLSAEKRD